MKFLLKYIMLLLCMIGGSAIAQNISISGSCFVNITTLIAGGDLSEPTFNGKPVYYNPVVTVFYQGSNVDATVHVYFATAASLSTPEDRWVLALDGQPFYYFISNSATAPSGTYLPFDGSAPVTDCGGSVNTNILIPTPIRLAAFEVKKSNEFIANISWISSQEMNNDFYTVEHSRDALHFEDIASIDALANGTSTSPLSYQFEHKNPVQGINYYRLRQTDLDGKSNIVSEIKMIHFDRISGSMSLYPNPSQGQMNLDLGNSQHKNTLIQILDMSGRLVLEMKANNQSNITTIDLQNLQMGVYQLQVKENNQTSSCMRFTKL